MVLSNKESSTESDSDDCEDEECGEAMIIEVADGYVIDENFRMGIM